MGLQKLLLASCSVFSLAMPIYAQEQSVRINLPAYELTLETVIDGKTEEKTYPISIGKGSRGRPITPIVPGRIIEKRHEILFTFTSHDPNGKYHAGDIIYWNRTFNTNGQPISHNVPYPRLRGLGLELIDPKTRRVFDMYVIHSNLDEFTLGIPASHGCIRVGVEDMLDLYKTLRPGENGKLATPVPIDIIYDILELKKEKLVLHADVYNIGIDTVNEFKATVGAAGYALDRFDYAKVKKEFDDAQIEFKETQTQILDLLSNSYPNNYVSPELKEKLHKEFDIEEFLKK